MSDWKDWEKEHGFNSEDGADNPSMAIQPYMGDPLCAEYERLCSVGADILKSMPDHDSKKEFSKIIEETWYKWCNHVDKLSDLLDSD